MRAVSAVAHLGLATLSATQSTSDALGVATLVIAIVGLVLAVASLAWQAATFVLSGSRVKVTLLIGGLRPDGAITWPISAAGGVNLPPGAAPILAVEVTNSGRTDVDVAGWGLEFGQGIMLVSPAFWANKDLPFRLLHGSQQTWFAAAQDAHAVVNGIGSTATVRGYVRLGNGRTVKSRERLPLSPTP